MDAYAKYRYVLDKAKISEARRKYYLENKSRILDVQREYKVQNKPVLAKAWLKYHKSIVSKIPLYPIHMVLTKGII